jgi:ABC-2 type transport system ATP-binding protein
MLEVRRLTKRFRAFAAVDDVSFTARPGEITGYLGPNGSGKSTTVKMVTGLMPPSEGEILFRGRNISRDLLAYKALVGYVPEEPYLYSYLTGAEYLEMVGELRSIPERRLKEKIDQFLRLFSLYGDRYTPLSSYSKGMRQKILIAAALLHNPELIVLDEPFSGLDITSTMVLRRLMRSLAEAGKVVLFSSHALEIVEKVCSEVVILHKGKVVANDSVSRLRDLMALPNLEDIFSQLVMVQNPDDVARDLVGVMQL